MTTSIDSNVLAALWNKDDPDNLAAANLLSRERKKGNLVISALVYSELMAGPLRDEAALDRFFADADIAIEWKIEEEIWRAAGMTYRDYARRRIRSGGGLPRRILADFIIGAHAVVRGYSLLTWNERDYATAFPKLKIVSR